jgi:hypothetical protein
LRLVSCFVLFVGLSPDLVQASPIVFQITKTLNATLNSGTAHIEQSWDFASLPGWNPVYQIASFDVQETFSGIGSGSNFRSTIINFTQPLGTAAATYFLFFDQAPAATDHVTLLAPYPCCNDSQGHNFDLSQITGNGVLGDFHTRIARNNGTFTAGTMTVTITANTPEPSTIVLMGTGFFVVGLFARKRRPARSPLSDSTALRSS